MSTEQSFPEGHPRAEGRCAAAAEGDDTLARLTAVIEGRKQADPETSYVARLFSKGEDAILKKIGEEATETVMAAKDGVAKKIVSETADLWFHCLVMLAHYGLSVQQVLEELRRREGLSGLQEKAARGERGGAQ
jgi:phosphoribosyl-ATP pyrophosphohydrolase